MSTNIEKLEHFVRLQTEQQNYMKSCVQKINNWQKFKDDYLNLKSRLDTLPHELRYQVTVPISKVAFMQGRLVNTNEILVLLGDNWFVEKSAKQACDVIDRRLININKFLEDLEKEKTNLSEQINWTQNLLKEKGEYVNIEEKFEEVKTIQPKKNFTEDQKKEIRRKLQEKALKTSLELENERKQSFKAPDKSKEQVESVEEEKEEEIEFKDKNENFMQKLQEDIKNMDVGEKFEEENLRQLMREYDEKIDRENNSKIEKKLKKQVKWSDIDQEKIQVEIMKDDEEENFSETETETEEDLDENIGPIRIEIKHTKGELIDQLDRKLKFSRDKAEINSPADIYNLFNRPKSILKNSGSFNSVDKTFESESVREEPKNAKMEKFEPHKAFSGEIIEKNVSSIQNGKNDSECQKPVSKFKASKFSQNK